jgi:hypothetical protein
MSSCKRSITPLRGRLSIFRAAAYTFALPPARSASISALPQASIYPVTRTVDPLISMSLNPVSSRRSSYEAARLRQMRFAVSSFLRVIHR